GARVLGRDGAAFGGRFRGGAADQRGSVRQRGGVARRARGGGRLHRAVQRGGRGDWARRLRDRGVVRKPRAARDRGPRARVRALVGGRQSGAGAAPSAIQDRQRG